MKLKKAHLILAIAAFTILLSSCKKNNATTNATDIANQLTASTWSIHYLYYNTDLTTQFSSYIVTFKKDSSVTIANSTESYTGTWFTQKQSDNSVSLNMQMNTATDMRFVNNNWKIANNDGALITMLDYASSPREFHLFRR